MSVEFTQEFLSRKTNSELEAIYEEALERLPSRAPIYLPTERIALIDRIIGVEHVSKIYREDLDAIYRPKLRALREKYKDHDRCFLIGNGPSLNRTDLSVLKDEVTFAVNGFFLKARDLDWKPTFYLVEDHLVAEDRAFWINQFDGPTKLFPAYLGYSFPAGEDTIFYNHRPRKSFPHGFDFSMEADKITYTGCTVTFSMMQIAAYLGFKEIYLIGVDASYDIPADTQQGTDYSVGVLDMKSDDPNHFDPNYFGKGFRWHDPQVQQMVEAYREAKRCLDGTPQKIINATVGGMLEVFERRSFQEIFPHARTPEAVEQENARLHNKKYPKLLILDMTALGNGTATGEVKATLFDGWPQDRLIQVARHGKDGLAVVTPDGEGGYATTPTSESTAWQTVEEFQPDVILYRQVPDVPWLHDFSMRAIRHLQNPVVTWLMDDWPAELEQTNPRQWAQLRGDLYELLANSALNLSICDKMSEAFAKRYGTTFRAFANGVNPVQWPALRHHEGQQLRLRYAGGLAGNMTLDSVLRVARAVERLADAGHPVSFEINTQTWWQRKSGDLFDGLKHTTVDAINLDAQDYRQWLSDADAVLIAYNFDEETLRYVRYSMANKMPECLASGAVVLCHGPREVATVDYLAQTGAAVIVDSPSDEMVERSILALSQSPARRNLLARKAREVAFSRHNVIDLREVLRDEIATAVQGHATTSGKPTIGLARALPLCPDSRSVLITAASYLLLDPKPTLEALTQHSGISAAVSKALENTASHDPARVHFNHVIAHTKEQGAAPRHTSE